MRFQEDIESSSWDFVGALIKGSDDHKGVGGWKVSAKYTPISPHPAFLGRSLKCGYVSTSACHELTCSLMPPGRVPVLFWVHECESIQVASHVEFKKAVKEHGRTFSASSIVIVKQLA